MNLQGIPPIELLAQETMRTIAGVRCDLSNEKNAQADIAEAITRSGMPFVREARLGEGDIADFLVWDRLAVEVKLRGAQKKAIYKQLERYARHDQVQGLLLVSNLSMGLPREIGGKPAWFLSLGRAWL